MRKKKHQPQMPERTREAGRDPIDDLKRTIIESGDAGRAPDLQAWSLGRRIARLEDLAYCFRDDLDQLKTARENHDERLTAHHKRLGALQRFVNELPAIPDDQLTSLAGRVDELERKAAVMHRDFNEHHNELTKFANSTLDRQTACEKEVERLDKEQTKQIALLKEELCWLRTRLGNLQDSVAGDSEICCEHLLRLARSLVYYLENVP